MVRNLFRSASVLLCSMLLAVTASAQTTVTLRNGLNNYVGTTDTHALSDSPGSGFGGPTATKWNVGYLTTRFMPLVRFKIFATEGGPVPDGATIVSATLSLNKTAGLDGVVELRRLLRDWHETQATWNNAATGTPWGVAGALGATDIAAAADGQASIGAGTGWQNIDVTVSVQAFAAGSANYGWRFNHVSGPNSIKEFVSRDNTATPDLRPTLQVVYTTGGGGTEVPSPKPGSGLAVPTFHSMSLYFNGGYDTGNPPEGSKFFVRYRRAIDDPIDDSVWKEGLPLWFDVRTTNSPGPNGCVPGLCGGLDLPYAWRGRGSVVHLRPGTKYVFEVGTGSSYASATWTHHIQDPNALDPRFPATWSETFPQDGSVVPIPSQSNPYVINAGGSAQTGYKIYDGANGNAKNEVNRNGAGLSDGPSHDDIDAGHMSQWGDGSFAIVIKQSYVIVRNVKATGAAAAGIVIYPGVTNVVIEDSEISDWSHRAGTPYTNPGCGTTPGCEEPTNPNTWTTTPWGMNEVGGIHLAGNNSRIVIQRNIITSPRNGAFPWDTHAAATCTANPANPNDHPVGPMGIAVKNGGQQNVFRYNEITGGDTPERNQWFMDGIGGKNNFGLQGAPGADSDVYQNIVMRVFDDAIEAEGGGRNVRVWGNYITDTKIAIGTTIVHYGPTYVWRNVINRVRTCYRVEQDVEYPSGAFKFGGLKWQGSNLFGDGKRYLLNNTLLQLAEGTVSDGAGTGIEGESDGGGSVRYTDAHNNILHVRKDTLWSFQNYTNNLGSVFTANARNGKWPTGMSPSANPLFSNGQLFYQPNHGPGSVPLTGGNGAGDYQLGNTSVGRKAGISIPNFTRDVDDPDSARRAGYEAVTGTCAASGDPGCPDAGAHQSGATQSMRFGVSAGQ